MIFSGIYFKYYGREEGGWGLAAGEINEKLRYKEKGLWKKGENCIRNGLKMVGKKYSKIIHIKHTSKLECNSAKRAKNKWKKL